MSEPYIDIWTGLKFIPSINGRLCPGNGRSFYADGTEIEICCDNCNTFNCCFPKEIFKF